MIEKKDCLIIDLHDIMNKDTIANVPTLFGFPCHFKFKPSNCPFLYLLDKSILELAPIVNALTEHQKNHATESEMIEQTKRDIYLLLNDIRNPKSVHDMVEEAILLKELTHLFWIHVSENIFTIKTPIGRYIIQKSKSTLSFIFKNLTNFLVLKAFNIRKKIHLYTMSKKSN